MKSFAVQRKKKLKICVPIPNTNLRPAPNLQLPMDIPGSSLVIPPHTALQAVRRIPWTYQLHKRHMVMVLGGHFVGGHEPPDVGLTSKLLP